ncbi:unnamed protein product [Calicophoron daubneyi]|uniref:Ferritin n=1 Tax=Calicophoron daubneyi TaxID=300641 RepID=A0AAV2THX0_CALDB
MQKFQFNLPSECEEKLNQVIDLFWGVERNYVMMAALCGSDVNLNGFYYCFNFCAARTRLYWEKFCKYLIVRGGQLNVNTIKPMIEVPKNLEHGVIPLMEITLQMEEAMAESLRELILLAKNKGDLETSAFVQTWPLRNFVRRIKWATYHLNGMKSCNNDHVYNRLCMQPLITAWKERVVTETYRPFERALLISYGEIQGVQDKKFGYNPMFGSRYKAPTYDTNNAEEVFVDMFNIY